MMRTAARTAVSVTLLSSVRGEPAAEGGFEAVRLLSLRSMLVGLVGCCNGRLDPHREPSSSPHLGFATQWSATASEQANTVKPIRFGNAGPLCSARHSASSASAGCPVYNPLDVPGLALLSIPSSAILAVPPKLGVCP
ncbi:hypothetical protein BV20DRAFT_378779 [Pilatotrama ljubarskyi]|nr:hypothetical protein BV20DRAFT_378779 [Pilatotrama ljubarskyi]